LARPTLTQGLVLTSPLRLPPAPMRQAGTPTAKAGEKISMVTHF
jgi:hypothetical protein